VIRSVLAGSSRGAKSANVVGVVVAEARAHQQARSQSATPEGGDLTTILVEFVRHVHEGQFDFAQRLAARPYREAIKPLRFGASVSANPYLKAGGRLVSRRVMLRDDTGRWDGTFESALGPVTLLPTSPKRGKLGASAAYW
jgi:hypothetical protein